MFYAMREEAEAYANYYKKLVGYTITETVVDDTDDGFLVGLKLKKGEETCYAWPLQDEEGNGPGFLHIIKDESDADPN